MQLHYLFIVNSISYFIWLHVHEIHFKLRFFVCLFFVLKMFSFNLKFDFAYKTSPYFSWLFFVHFPSLCDFSFSWFNLCGQFVGKINAWITKTKKIAVFFSLITLIKVDPQFVRSVEFSWMKYERWFKPINKN